MYRRLLLVVCFMLFVAACQASEPEAPSAPDDLVEARDTALAHVQARYLIGSLPLTAWYEDQVADLQVADWVEYQYTAMPWVVTIGGPLPEVGADFFDVVVSNPVTGFWWEGRVEPSGQIVEGSEQVLAACDYTCDLLSEQFPQLELADLKWTGRRVPPVDLVGREVYQYTAEDWKLTVSYPVVAPDVVTYDVTLENEETGFVWEGEMDSDRNLTETNAYSRVPGGGSA